MKLRGTSFTHEWANVVKNSGLTALLKAHESTSPLFFEAVAFSNRLELQGCEGYMSGLRLGPVRLALKQQHLDFDRTERFGEFQTGTSALKQSFLFVSSSHVFSSRIVHKTDTVIKGRLRH